MAGNEFSRIRGERSAIRLAGGQVGMGELESNEWEKGRGGFKKAVTPRTTQRPERVDDEQVRSLSTAVRQGVQAVRIQEPLVTEDQPASTLVWNVYDNVGWAAGAPAVQRVDIGPVGRQWFWCFSIGVPIFAIWIAPGQNVQAAIAPAVPGQGIPLNAPSAAGVYDGSAWSCSVGDDVHFYASGGGAGCRLVVVEGVRV